MSIWTAVTAGAQTVSGLQCLPTNNLKEKNLAFQGGEKLDYVLHYQWGPINSDVAKASIKVDTLVYNGVPAFYVSLGGRTARFYDTFFKVREDFQSWFTRDGLRPLRFTRDTNEGSYVCRNNYRFVRDGSDSYIDADLYTSRKGDYNVRMPLTACTYDLVSLFFNARNMDMSKIRQGVPYPMTFALDDDIFNIYFTYYGKEIKRVKGIGKVKCMRFSFNLVEGEVFDAGQDMLLWISDDDNRIPICFECNIKVGKVTGRVEGYSGLKHPFRSLVQG